MSQVEIVNSAIIVIQQLFEENMTTRRKIFELQGALTRELGLQQAQTNSIQSREQERENITARSRESHLGHFQVPSYVNQKSIL
jgi:hypothetical protein